MNDPREEFADLARCPDAEIGLARGALLVAAEEYPGLDLDACLARLDEHADEAGRQLGEARGGARRVERLNHYLFGLQGFAGNRDDYDDPRNSFLNDVLERRLGIPITLSLVYMEVARRLDLPVDGVSFPGHFLVKLSGPELVVVDCFYGRVLSLADCRERLDALTGAALPLRPELHLRAASPREILVRLLSNLKHRYAGTGDFGRALACCERILLLTPDAPTELRDRGLVYDRLECPAAARADLERFLALAPDDETAAAVRQRLAALRAPAHRLH